MGPETLDRSTPPAGPPHAGYLPAPPGLEAPRAPTHGSAIGALIMAIVWLCGLGSILAVFLGLKARREIKESRGALGGDGLAMAGIVVGGGGVALSVLVWSVVILGNIFLPDLAARTQLEYVLKQGQRAQQTYMERNGEYAKTGFALREVGFEVEDRWLRVFPHDDGGYCMEVSLRTVESSTYMHIEDGATTPSPGRCGETIP